jgi:hypothetical protein
MSATGYVPANPPLHVVAGRRSKTPPKEILCTRPDALFFRAQTQAIIRHFFEISCQIGRLPSILGREFFRAKVSHRRVPSFEEQVVFVHDVERAMARLNPQNLEIVSLVGLYQYFLGEATKVLGRSRSTVAERYAEAVDTLAQIFLETGLLREDRPDRRIQRFDQVRGRDLPPKKPAASVAARTDCVRAGEHQDVRVARGHAV